MSEWSPLLKELCKSLQNTPYEEPPGHETDQMEGIELYTPYDPEKVGLDPASSDEEEFE
jgi:hypothetical protein